MSDQTSKPAETVVPFPNHEDPLDKTGQAVCGQVQRAARISEEKAQRVLNSAHKLSMQLRDAEDRIANLQAETKHYRERADRAEKWLHRIALEIEHSFFEPTNAQQSTRALTETEDSRTVRAETADEFLGRGNRQFKKL